MGAIEARSGHQYGGTAETAVAQVRRETTQHGIGDIAAAMEPYDLQKRACRLHRQTDRS